ncbi:MAG: 6-phosphogluconolactonase [Phycisphaerae bacterium]
MTEPNATRNVVVKSSETEVARYIAARVKEITNHSVTERGACRLALAGGTTPYALYHLLGSEGLKGDIPWQQVDVFFGDERDVPQDHIDSIQEAIDAGYYLMVQRTLLDRVPIVPDRVHPMPADASDLQQAAGEYERRIREVVPAGPNGVPMFDLILLGLGSDGHTASLFPENDVIREGQRLVVAYHVPALGRSRMSFTYPLINAARHIIMMVTGEDKAEAVRRLLQDSPDAWHIPAAGVVPYNNGELTLVLDALAARNTGMLPG